MKRVTEAQDWVEVNGARAIVGVTVNGAEELGEVTYVELPKVGDRLKNGDLAVVVESSKAAIDLMAPVDGVVVEVNEALNREPQLLSKDPEGKGWLYVLGD